MPLACEDSQDFILCHHTSDYRNGACKQAMQHAFYFSCIANSPKVQQQSYLHGCTAARPGYQS